MGYYTNPTHMRGTGSNMLGNMNCDDMASVNLIWIWYMIFYIQTI